MDAQAYARNKRDETLAELIELASIPSVSTDPAYAVHIQEAAEWVAGRMRRPAGLDRGSALPVGRPRCRPNDPSALPGAPVPTQRSRAGTTNRMRPGTA